MHLSGVCRWGFRLGLLLEQTGKSLERLVRSTVHLIQGVIGNGVGLCVRLCLRIRHHLLRNVFHRIIRSLGSYATA